MLLLKQDMSANNLCVMGSTPIPDFVGIAQWLEQQTMSQVRILLPTINGIAQLVEHYIRDVA